MTIRRSPGAAALVLASAIAALALGIAPQAVHPVSGRRIAGVMGVGGAAWLDRDEREAEEAPAKAIAALRIAPGQVVADIGAGSGYYTVRLAQSVGAAGRVYAVDIQPEMLAIIRRRIDKDQISNVELVQSTEVDPKLPEGSVDLALMVDVYHELSRPQEMLRAIRKALKPDGRLVLIEFRKESEWVPIREEHKMSVREARMELEAERYSFDRVLDVLPWQHILIFRP